jgi:hypothetical protein
MERRMMEVIKARAEGRAVSAARDNVQVALWFIVTLAGAVAAVQFLAGRQSRRRFVVFLVAGVLLQGLTFVQPTPFLGVPLTVALLLAGWLPRAWVRRLQRLGAAFGGQAAPAQRARPRLETT